MLRTVVRMELEISDSIEGAPLVGSVRAPLIGSVRGTQRLAHCLTDKVAMRCHSHLWRRHPSSHWARSSSGAEPACASR
jgi:hypothetical protein